MTTPQINFEHLFDELPVGYIVFNANNPDFTIIAQNDEHARVSLAKKGEVIGKKLLDAYPDTSEKFQETGKSDLVASLQKVLKTGKPDEMPAIKYDIKNSKGIWEEKYWQATHYPIKDNKGKVTAIYQSTREITDEVLTSKRLEHAEEQFRLAADNGLISVWNWDIAEEKVYADRNLCNLFGIDSKDGEKGLPLEQFIASIHPEDRERVQNEITNALKTRAHYETEYRTLTHDGVRYVIARGAVNGPKHQPPKSFSGIIVDITARKLAEQSVSESEDRLRFMADSMPQLVWITRPDGYHEYYNQRWYDYTGTALGSTDGEGWNNLFHHEDQAAAWKRWRHSLKTGEEYEINYRLYHAPSETYRWVIGRALPYRDSSGKIVKWYGTCTDIHDVKVAEENLAFLAEATSILSSSLDYKKTFRRIAELSVPEIADWCTLDILDQDGQLQLAALAHKDPAKVAWAQELREKQGPPDLTEEQGVAQVMRTGQAEMYPHITDEMMVASAKSEQELRLLRELNLSSLIMTPLIVDKKTVGVLTLISTNNQRSFTENDLTMANELAARASIAVKNSLLYNEAKRELSERKKLERQLKASNEQLEARVKLRTKELERLNLNLERSNRELEDFAYVASHDLQEPLRKIQAFGDLLRDEYGEVLGDGKDYLSRMQSAAGRMSLLINDLLKFSRVSTKQSPLVKLDLKLVVDDVLDDLEDRIKRTGGVVHVGTLPTVHADPVQMRQLFQNLIANALKFHRPDVTPDVKVFATELTDPTSNLTYDVISFSDNGVGFDEKYLDRIFAVFQRLHGRDAYEGTGIGLAVCRKIVERHGGTISAKSDIGKGATFIVSLPRQRKRSK